MKNVIKKKYDHTITSILIHLLQIIAEQINIIDFFFFINANKLDNIKLID